MVALFATSGLFAASLSVTSVLPEPLELKVNGWSYYSGSNTVTVINLYDGYNRITVSCNEIIFFDHDVLLKEDYLTDITFNRFGTAMIDQRIYAEPIDNNYLFWD